MSKTELNRHEIREKAVQALFPLDFQEVLSKQEAISYVIELEHEDWLDEDEMNFVPDYLDQLVAGVITHQDSLDQEIEKYLRNWQLSRIAKIDLTILRLALFEMNYVKETPDKVALNEALELSKRYSDDASRKFINGILSNVLKDKNSKE